MEFEGNKITEMINCTFVLEFISPACPGSSFQHFKTPKSPKGILFTWEFFVFVFFSWTLNPLKPELSSK